MTTDEAIDEAMKVIKENTYGDAEGSKLIRQQLELVAKAARRQALNDAADYVEETPNTWAPHRELRRMAEEAK